MIRYGFALQCPSKLVIKVFQDERLQSCSILWQLSCCSPEQPVLPGPAPNANAQVFIYL